MTTQSRNQVLIAFAAVIAVVLVVILFLRNDEPTVVSREDVRPTQSGQRDLPANSDERGQDAPERDKPDTVAQQPAEETPISINPADFLCQHEFQVVWPEGAARDGLTFTLEFNGRSLTTKEDVRAVVPSLVGNAPDGAVDQLARRIVDSWPPVVAPNGRASITLGSNVKARLKAQTAAGLNGTLLMFRCSGDIEELELEETWDLEGYVRTSLDEIPLPGVRVQLTAEGVSHTAITDVDGKFVATDLPDQQLFLIIDESSIPGYIQETSPLYIFPQEVVQPLTVSVLRADDITFRITNEFGEPVSGAQVTLVPPSEERGSVLLNAKGVALGVSGEDGLATLRTQLDGSREVTVRHEKYEAMTTEMNLQPGETREITLRPLARTTIAFVDKESGEPYNGELVVLLERDGIKEFPNVRARSVPEESAYSVKVAGPLEVILRDSTKSFTVKAFAEDSNAFAEVTFTPEEISSALKNDTPLEVPMEVEVEETVIVVHDVSGQVPEDYRVEVAFAHTRRERYDAAELRAEYDPQASFETLLVPIAPVFPLTVKVVGVNNFLGEQTFHQPQEFYEIQASRSRFVIVTLDEPGYGPNLKPGRRIEPRLTVNPPGATHVMSGGVYKGYLPMGQIEITVEWYDADTGEQKKAIQEIYIEESKNPLELTMTERVAPPAEE